MTKSQIKQELRRSACIYGDLWVKMHDDAFHEAEKFMSKSESYAYWSEEQSRIFCLLVAGAL